MSGNVAGLVEMLFVLGVFVAVGVHELLGLRGTKPAAQSGRADRAERAERADTTAPDAGDQERDSSAQGGERGAMTEHRRDGGTAVPAGTTIGQEGRPS